MDKNIPTKGVSLCDLHHFFNNHLLIASTIIMKPIKQSPCIKIKYAISLILIDSML